MKFHSRGGGGTGPQGPIPQKKNPRKKNPVGPRRAALELCYKLGSRLRPVMNRRVCCFVLLTRYWGS